MQRLVSDINRFYRRWHLLEVSLGHRGGSVLDFDFVPSEAGPPPPAYDSRWSAMAELEGLIRRAEEAASSWASPAFLLAKLRGSYAYLRALEGERLPLARYVQQTMGFTPERVPRAELVAMAERLTRHFAERGIPFERAGYAAYREAFILQDLSDFEPELRACAQTWMARVRQRLRLPVEPRFRLEVVTQDAYWANWVDGAAGVGIRLRANIHPRIEYQRCAALTLAVHEIAGHAAHVLAVSDASLARQVDLPSLNVTVHSCEAFHMEGLAQAALLLLAEPGEVPPDVLLREDLAEFNMAVINNAHLDLEEGRPLPEVVEEVLEVAPFVGPLSVRSTLRDRMTNALFRSYLFVYGPSRSLFLRALALPPPRRLEFLRSMYTSFFTPGQIRSTLEELLGGAPSPLAGS